MLTLIDAINYQNKILDSILGELSAITTSTTAKLANSVKTNSLIQKLAIDVNKDYSLERSWDNTIEAINYFVKHGDKQIMSSGSHSSVLKGDLHGEIDLKCDIPPPEGLGKNSCESRINMVDFYVD